MRSRKREEKLNVTWENYLIKVYHDGSNIYVQSLVKEGKNKAHPQTPQKV